MGQHSLLGGCGTLRYVKLALVLVLAGLHLHGPHVHHGMRVWALQDQMPFPSASIGVYYGDPARYPGNQVYLPRVGADGWSVLAVRGLFFHEIGHVYDHEYMTPALRKQFMEAIGVYPACSKWLRNCRTVRWVVNDYSYVTIQPAEMFAEEYAACALGLTQLGYQEAGYNTYGWVPPKGTGEAQLCSLISSASA